MIAIYEDQFSVIYLLLIKQYFSTLAFYVEQSVYTWWPPKKTERPVFDGLSILFVTFSCYLDRASSSELNDTKIINFGLVLSIL